MSREQLLIRNCRFAFRCHQRWDALEETNNIHVRYCHECSQDVVLCRTDEDLLAALQANHCVAVPGTRPAAMHTVGILVPPSTRDV